MNLRFTIYPIMILFSVGMLFTACKKTVINGGSSGGLQISGFSKSVGVAKDLVTVYGAGFDPVSVSNVVSIGSSKMEVVDGSINKLRVLIPEDAKTGRITITTASSTIVSDSLFTIAVLIEGRRIASESWTSNQQYLLRGNVIFDGGTSLSIEAGTHIFCEKATKASLSLTATAGVSAAPSVVNCKGTADQPVIFTSDQPPGRRAPGDWRGIRINTLIGSTDAQGKGAAGVFEYVRIEYAGYYDPNNQNLNIYTSVLGTIGDRGAALTTVGLNERFNTINHVQVSFSAGDGFHMIDDGFISFKYIIAYCCAGHDFYFDGFANDNVQFALGLKDPTFANSTGSDGVFVNNTASYLNVPNVRPVIDGPALSNVTLVGWNTSARNFVRKSYNGIDARYIDSVVTINAGRGLHVVKSKTENISIDHVALCNSVIVGSWKAGASFDGQGVWANYEAEIDQRSILRHNIFTATAGRNFPVLAGSLGYEVSGPGYSYFQPIPLADISKYAQFKAENIADNSNYSTSFYDGGTARILKCPENNPDPNAACPLTTVTPRAADNLSIKGLVDVKNLSRPVLLPGSDSPLLSSQPPNGPRFGTAPNYSYGPTFSGIPRIADVSFFERVSFIGAFGSSDWSSPWTSFVPNQEIY